MKKEVLQEVLALPSINGASTIDLVLTISLSAPSILWDPFLILINDVRAILQYPLHPSTICHKIHPIGNSSYLGELEKN